MLLRFHRVIPGFMAQAKSRCQVCDISKISNVLLQMLQPAYGALMVLRVSTARSGSNFSAICLSWSKWLPKMAQMFL